MSNGKGCTFVRPAEVYRSKFYIKRSNINIETSFDGKININVVCIAQHTNVFILSVMTNISII